VDSEQQRDWFTFPVTTTRSIVQFKVCSRALVGPDILLGSVSIGLREMIASASKIGTELPDPTDPDVQAEHKLLGVSDHDLDIRQGDKRRSTKTLKEKGILHVAMHLQLRSLDGAPNMLPVTRRLRSIVLTSDFLSNDARFEVIDEDDEAAPESVSQKPPRQISHNIVSSDGAIMCVEISVLECTALHSKGQGNAVRPLIRLRLHDPQRKTPVDPAGVDDESQYNLSEEEKKVLQTRPEILMVALNMQSIFRGKLARKDYRKKKKSLEILSSNQAPCEFDDRTFRLHTNRFSQHLVVDVLDNREPGKLPTFLGSIEMPVASLTLPSFTGDHWHIVAPPTNGNRRKAMTRVATKLQAYVRAKQQYADFKRRTQAPLYVIYLLGGPGSGKTTLGKRLADNLGLIHFSSGEMLRRALRQKENAHVASRIRLAMEEGVPVPNDVILPLLRRAIARLRYHRDGGTILLDGVPFSDAQRDLLEKIPTDELPGPARVFLLDCDEDTMISRSMNRAEDLRDDSTEEAANTMVATFRKVGMPVVEYYQQHGILTEIDTGRAATEEESYAALVSSLTTCMVDAGYWSAAGEPLNRSKETSGTRTADRQGEIPKVPALRLRISARRAGLAGASRTLIGIMRWRRQARQRAQAKAQAAVDSATSAAAVPVVKLGIVTEDGKEEKGEVRGGLTVEV
jgi:adenylate kinase family enzyme